RSSLPVDRLEEREELTVLEYGIPDLSAFSAGGPEDQKRIAEVGARAGAAFEPRPGGGGAALRRRAESGPAGGLRVSGPGGGGAAALRIEARLAVDEVSEPIAFPTLLSVKGGEALVRLAELAENAEEEPAAGSGRR